MPRTKSQTLQACAETESKTDLSGCSHWGGGCELPPQAFSNLGGVSCTTGLSQQGSRSIPMEKPFPKGPSPLSLYEPASSPSITGCKNLFLKINK